jgi:ribosome-binding protein aMBF1 (putative translation factor)
MKPRYAIVYRGVVTSRFPTREQAAEALRALPPEARRRMKVLPVTAKEVRRYYARVNRARRRSGLPPLNPGRW